MINRILRRILLKILGDKNYLFLVSNIFLKMYHSGKAKKKYPEMYLLNRFVSEGDTCLDIGANLGYYTIPLAELVGSSGKVFAVEPVGLFREILTKNLGRYDVTSNVDIIPYALGNIDGQEIEMGTPEVDGLIHFGYTRILSPENQPFKIKNSYKVRVYRPQTIFKDLKALHFIKCDIEGYEGKVIPELIEIIKKFKPSLQIEILTIENRRIIINLLKSLDYCVFYYLKNKLTRLVDYDNFVNNKDLFFLQPEKIATLRDIIVNKD